MGKKKAKKKKQNRGMKNYFRSKYELGPGEERELDKGPHGDYVTGQIGAGTLNKERKKKKKSREMAATAPVSAASSSREEDTECKKRSRRRANTTPNIFPVD